MADPKYSTDDLKAMVDKGTAMKNASGDPSYPVADQEDIEKAVKAVGRGGADHDAIRQHVMAGAKALKLTDLIPDTWQADGSLKTEKARWTAPSTRTERRTASLSFGNIQTAVAAALQDSFQAKFPNGAPSSSWFDVWIADLGADWVVFQCWEPFPGTGTWRVGYTLDGAVATITGDPVEVVAQTSFVPAGGQTNDAVPAGETRAAKKVDCPTCTGKGTIREGNMKCPDCDGTGQVLPDVAAGSQEASSSAARRRPRRAVRQLERGSERRVFDAKIELRTAAIEGDEAVLRGLPIRYEARYDVRDFKGVFHETMKPGVIDNVLGRELDCRFLVNHSGVPYARTVNSTLILTDTPDGVVSEAHVDLRRSDARDLALAITRGDVTQMSCGFVVADDGDDWSVGADGVEDRSIYSFEELFDVSAVTYPASPTTSIEMAQRALARLDVESRERIRRLWSIAKEVRAGKVLSQQNGQDLADALEALHNADDIDIPGIVTQLQTINEALDKGQAGLSAVLDRANPDGDAKDLQPTLEPPDKDADARSRQLARLNISRARQRHLRDAA